MKLTEREVETRTILEEHMRRNGKTSYRSNGFMVTLEKSEKAKVRRVGEEAAAE